MTITKITVKMTVNLDKQVELVTKYVQGEAFFNAHLIDALIEAQGYAGKNGYVASMPQLLNGRVTSPYGDEIWTNFFTANSKEYVGKTAQGNPVVVAIHSGGISSYGKISEAEIKNLLEGRLSDENQIPVYSFSEFKNGIFGLPRQYAVVMDFDEVKKTDSGYQDADGLENNSLFIVRTGGVEQAHEYIKKVKDYYQTNKYGHSHPFANADPNKPQGYWLSLGNQDFDGISDLDDSSFSCRFVAVKEDITDSLIAPTLQEILAITGRFTDLTDGKKREDMNIALSALYFSSKL